MKMYTSSVGMIVAVTCSICFTNSTCGQALSRGFSRTSGFSTGRASGTGSGNESQGDYDRYGPRTGTRFQQGSHASVSGSRSVSFLKNGKRVSIRENQSGISVSVNGETVRANDPTELKKQYPDAYRLYEEHIGAARYRGSASGSSGGSASSEGSATGKPPQFNRSSSGNRSVSVIENGEKVSITEHRRGITVSINGKRVRAKNAADLKEKSPDAFRMYERHLGAGNGHNGQSDARVMLQEELNKLRDDNADNPQLKSLIEKMMQNAPR